MKVLDLVVWLEVGVWRSGLHRDDRVLMCFWRICARLSWTSNAANYQKLDCDDDLACASSYASVGLQTLRCGASSPTHNSPQRCCKSNCNDKMSCGEREIPIAEGVAVYSNFEGQIH